MLNSRHAGDRAQAQVFEAVDGLGPVPDCVTRLYDNTRTQVDDTISLNDDKWASGGIGWSLNRDTDYADYARIEL